jgi:hypothetical protein
VTFKALLTADECLNIIEDFDSSTQTSVETEVFYNNSIGLWQPVTSLKHVEKFQRMLEPTYGPLKFENTYMRSYVKDSTLKMHTDRPGLDITLSICLTLRVNGRFMRVKKSGYIRNGIHLCITITNGIVTLIHSNSV